MIMFYFGFDISWPYKINKKIIDILYKDYSISKNKAIEIQLSKFGNSFTIIGFDFGLHPYQSHGGLRISIDLLGYSFIIKIYDKRHWDYETGTWEVYEKDETNGR